MAGGRHLDIDCGSSRCTFAQISGRSMIGRSSFEPCRCLQMHRSCSEAGGWSYTVEFAERAESLMRTGVNHIHELHHEASRIERERPKVEPPPVNSIFGWHEARLADVVIQPPTAERRSFVVVIKFETRGGESYSTGFALPLGDRPRFIIAILTGWLKALRFGPDL